MKERSLIMTFLAVFALAVVAACTTLLPTTKYPSKAAVDYVLHQRQGNAIVGVEPLTTQEQVIEWFGIDLTKNGLVALHLVIENGRDSTGGMVLLTDQVVLGDSALKAGVAAQTKLSEREVSPEEIARQRVVGFISGGLLGLALTNAGATDVHLMGQVSLQNRMRELALRSDTLRPGETARGFVYFRVQQPWDSNSRMILALTLKNIRTGERVHFNIELPESKLPFLATPN